MSEQDATLDEFVSDKPSSKERRETSIGELPSDWAIESLDNICSINPDGFSEDDWPDQMFEYISLSDVSEGTILRSETTPIDDAPSRAQRQIRGGDVLVGTVRPKQISHGFVTEEHNKKICSSGFGVLRPPANLNSVYLLQEVLSHRFFRQMEAYVAGSGYPAIKISDLRKHRIALPPLKEQRKIASVLYALDKAIQKTEDIIQQTERIHTGLRRELVITGIDHKEFQEMRVGPFNFEIPVSWEIVSIDEACENLDKDRIPVKQAEREEMQGDIPYYGASGIIDYVDDYLFDDDLILLAEDGENLLSRNLPMSFKISGKAWVNNHAHVLKPREEFDIDYLVEFFERLNYEPFVTGSAQPKLTQTNMGMLSVPKPPEEEQAEIASVLTSFIEHKKRNEIYKEKLQKLKRGLMQDLLSGEVRTNHKDIEVFPEVEKHG